MENSCDTVTIEAPAYLILNDTSIHLLHDTTTIICNRYIVLTKRNGYTLYSKIASQMKKHSLVDELLQMLLEGAIQDTMLLKQAIMEAEDAYSPYAGKIIKEIKIQVLDPFGSAISDTNLPTVTKLGRTLNKSHVKTRQNIIKSKLHFDVNDAINPYELVENTRTLTELNFLQDAAIIVYPAEGDSVSVLVIVKDKFPWLPQPQYYTINRMKLYLKNVNMFGMGQSLGVGLTYDSKSTPILYLSDVNYYVDNIYKQVSGAFNFHVSDNDLLYQILFNRDLMPMNIQLGGGLEISQKEEVRGIDPRNIDPRAWYFKYQYYDLWASYLINDKAKQEIQNNKYLYFIPGVAINKRDYIKRPHVSIDSNSMFNNYTNLLTNIALVRQRYYRTNYMTNFGKAEYLPYGFQFSFTSGYSWAEFMNSPYVGFGAAATTHINKLGFLFVDFEFGTHFSKNLEQGTVNINLSLLSNLFKNGRYRHRILTDFSYTNAINRFTNEMIYLDDEFGFVGIDVSKWYGTKRLSFEVDYFTYTPWYLLGFRVAIYGFASGALLGESNKSIFKSQFLSSMGAGIYVRNDFLAMESFQIRFSYFPKTPDGISNFGISFTTVQFIKPFNFLNTKPHLVEYN